MASKVRSRIPLDAEIGGATWSPWNGVTIRNIRLRQPEPLRATARKPLLTMARLHVVPVWTAWLKGVPEVREISLISPEVELPLELISHFAPPAIPPPALARQDPALPPGEGGSPGTPSAAPPVMLDLANAPPALAGGSPASPTLPSPPLQPPAAGAEGGPETGPPQPTGFVHLRDASFSVTLGGQTVLFDGRGISGSVPVAGGATETMLAFASISLPGAPPIKDLRFPLKWQAPVLALPLTDVTIAGLKAGFQMRCVPVGGIPLEFEMLAPEQIAEKLPLPGDGTFSSPSAGIAIRFRGLLVRPSTWQAECIAKTLKPEIYLGGRITRFDQGSAIAVLQAGTLSCPDARLVGDDLSLLGNATVHSDGRAAGVLRVVAPPETAMGIVRNLFPGTQAPPAFSAMSTPQRAALDLEAAGTLGDIRFRLGKNGPIVGPPAVPAATPP